MIMNTILALQATFYPQHVTREITHLAVAEVVLDVYKLEVPHSHLRELFLVVDFTVSPSRRVQGKSRTGARAVTIYIC